eukprot:CAMPEP_0174332162 /NCGR_PEP_ID=MMETSP0810-20121108/18090_1 /TAXON_ID=73025 ORGANISM="Eutreptiella gymnastica-like, Strain CCMP1594" /NCGR_SAMPLE_ID=MMETSP0810 /ASSEMBLY_ACC=CAM_ASM_000659 /LENGTH=54 /DNA_ID=CAMNT_0015448431 /DNA_START=258 /DNA_END=419 /DNA_ORIENTATION=-
MTGAISGYAASPSVVGQFDFPGTNSGPSWVLGGGTRNRQCSTHMNVLTLCWAGG